MPSHILATAGYEHTVRLWEVSSGYCYRALQHQDSSAFVYGGQLFYCNALRQLTSRPICSPLALSALLPLISQHVNALAFSPNKQYLAAAGHQQVRIYDIATNNVQPISTLTGHKLNVSSTGYFRDGQRLFSGGEEGSLRVWDLRTNAVVYEVEVDEACMSLCLHSDQYTMVAGLQTGGVRVVDIRQNGVLHSFKPVMEHDSGIQALSLSSNGKRAAFVNLKGTATIYDITSADQWDVVCSWKAHDKYVLRAAFSPDSTTLATSSADSTVKIWNCKKEFSLERTLTGHQRWVWDIAYSSQSNYIVSVSSDNTARLWDVAKGEMVRHYPGHRKAITCVALHDYTVASDS